MTIVITFTAIPHVRNFEDLASESVVGKFSPHDSFDKLRRTGPSRIGELLRLAACRASQGSSFSSLADDRILERGMEITTYSQHSPCFPCTRASVLKLLYTSISPRQQLLLGLISLKVQVHHFLLALVIFEI
jgi:hypothetical protein